MTFDGMFDLFHSIPFIRKFYERYFFLKSITKYHFYSLLVTLEINGTTNKSVIYDTILLLHCFFSYSKPLFLYLMLTNA